MHPTGIPGCPTYTSCTPDEHVMGTTCTPHGRPTYTPRVAKGCRTYTPRAAHGRAITTHERPEDTPWATHDYPVGDQWTPPWAPRGFPIDDPRTTHPCTPHGNPMGAACILPGHPTYTHLARAARPIYGRPTDTSRVTHIHTPGDTLTPRGRPMGAQHTPHGCTYTPRATNGRPTDTP